MEAKEESLRAVRLVSSYQTQLIEGSRHFLYMLSQLPQVQDCEPASCSSLFASLMKQYPWFLNIAAAYPDGKVFASALPPAKPVNISDRGYFRLALKTRKFSIGDYQIGRIHGKPSVNFGYPVLDEDGRVKCVLIVSLSLDWLAQASTSASLPPGSTITVIDHEGMILVRHPGSEGWVGKRMTEAPIVKAILSQREGTVETSGVDGNRRLYAFTQFGGKDGAGSLYASVGIPASLAFSEVDRVLRRNLGFLALVGFIAFAVSWLGGSLLVLRRLDPIMNAAKRLGAGDLGARTGIICRRGEFGELALAFDQMASSLQQREFEREQAQEKLMASEKRYRELADQLPEPVFEADETGNLTFANKKASEVFGYTEEDLERGLNVFQMVVPEEYDTARETFVKALKGEVTEHEFAMRRKDGGTFFAVVYAASVTVQGGPPRLRGIVVDVTERKRAEEALRRSESRYRTMFENTGCATIIIEEDTTISLVNAEFEKLTGYSKEETEGKKKWTELIDRRDLQRSMEFHRLRRIDPNLAPRCYEVRFTDKAGNSKEALATVSVIPETKQAIASLLDMTPLREAEREKAALEEQFRLSQRMEAVGLLAGGIAHDFNNSLTVIKGYSQLCLTELQGSDSLRESIEEILKAADRGANLTRQLLAFSRRQVLDMKVFDLNMVVQDLGKLLGRILGEDIELIISLAEDAGRVKTDPGQIEHVIMNLAANARDAMPNGGKLIIETANVVLDEGYALHHVAVKPGSYVMLSVSDTGCGMTPEVKERIFEPFFTTKERGKGTGLGLSMVYGIVKQSGGNIWVYSEPGKGTTFKIYLPRVEEPPEQLMGAVKTEGLPSGSESILIVEDDEAVKRVAAEVLKKQGYTVLEANGVLEAVSLCKERRDPIDLILMDVVIPGTNGRKLIETLRDIRNDFKILYMSGYTDNGIVHQGVLERGVEFIQKPLTMESLAKKVREVLDKESMVLSEKQ